MNPTPHSEAAFSLRPAQDAEMNQLMALAQEHGLANVARVLFNLNEFAFVD